MIAAAVNTGIRVDSAANPVFSGRKLVIDTMLTGVLADGRAIGHRFAFHAPVLPCFAAGVEHMNGPPKACAAYHGML